MTTCYQPLGAVEIRRAALSDLAAVGELARFTWRACYPRIITREQIEYMLAQRYTGEAMTDAVTNQGLLYDLVLVDGTLVGFAGHAPGEVRGEWQLRQLYLHPDWQRHGLGGRLIRHVESVAAAAGCGVLVLTVNRRNAQAIGAYQKAGFAIRESKDFPIGNGFLMEDFVMSKSVEPGSPDPG